MWTSLDLTIAQLFCVQRGSKIKFIRNLDVSRTQPTPQFMPDKCECLLTCGEALLAFPLVHKTHGGQRKYWIERNDVRYTIRFVKSIKKNIWLGRFCNNANANVQWIAIFYAIPLALLRSPQRIVARTKSCLLIRQVLIWEYSAPEHFIIGQDDLTKLGACLDCHCLLDISPENRTLFFLNTIHLIFFN